MVFIVGFLLFGGIVVFAVVRSMKPDENGRGFWKTNLVKTSTRIPVRTDTELSNSDKLGVSHSPLPYQGDVARARLGNEMSMSRNQYNPMPDFFGQRFPEIPFVGAKGIHSVTKVYSAKDNFVSLTTHSVYFENPEQEDAPPTKTIR